MTEHKPLTADELDAIEARARETPPPIPPNRDDSYESLKAITDAVERRALLRDSRPYREDALRLVAEVRRLQGDLAEASREAAHWNDEWRNVRNACEEICPAPEDLECVRGLLREIIDAQAECEEAAKIRNGSTAPLCRLMRAYDRARAALEGR